MNESMKQYLDKLPDVKPLDQTILDAHMKDMAERVVPEIEEALRQQKRLNAESLVLAVLRPNEQGQP